jgi:hypothetical protein
MEYEKYKKLSHKWGFFWIAYYINFIKISYGAMHCALQISYQAEAAWHMIKIPDDYATLIVPTN